MTKKDKDTQPAPAEPVEGRASARPPSEEELQAANTQAAENWDKFLRAAAELENYRKRVAREKEELARYTTERLIGTLLPALDNLERALEHSDEDTSLHDGLLQVHKQFQRALADFGLVEIVAKPGDHFNPEIHEAVSHVESADHPDGIVIEQLLNGYKLADRLLRPARVAVSKGPSAPEILTPAPQIPE
jgi:molecular chaperone GrpE